LYLFVCSRGIKHVVFDFGQYEVWQGDEINSRLFDNGGFDLRVGIWLGHLLGHLLGFVGLAVGFVGCVAHLVGL
jgi:hypothetical protein